MQKHTVEYKDVKNPISEYDLFWAIYNKNLKQLLKDYNLDTNLTFRGLKYESIFKIDRRMF
ncbi:hypothetical protein Q5M85_12620 [Paraclostridium bifermentans]|nr:hypothetical protein [Paraclostridium bifermentans]